MRDDALKRGKSGLNRLNDRLFKYIFASRQHKANLIRFLNDVLDDPERIIADIEYLDREQDPPILQGKGTRFDVRAKASDGRIFQVEVQVRDEDDFLKRCLFYTCANYTSQIVAGEPYGQLGEVVFIAVLDFNAFFDKPDTYHSVQRMLDVENHKCYCSGVEMHFLELPKMRKLGRGKSPDRMTGLERMLMYMGTMGGTEVLNEIAAYDSDIRRILNMEEAFVKTPELWVNYLIREREQSDWENYVKSQEARGRAEGEARGRAEGEAKGRAEGEAKGRAETARNLIRMGLDLDKIAQATGLPMDEVEALRAGIIED